VLAFLTGEAKDGAAAGALAENVGRRISGKGGTGLSEEFIPKAEPGLVFFPTAGNIVGKETIHGNDQQDQRQYV
jgi:hypothetical protein